MNKQTKKKKQRDAVKRFNAWILSQQLPIKKISISYFPDSGRGVSAMEPIKVKIYFFLSFFLNKQINK